MTTDQTGAPAMDALRALRDSYASAVRGVARDFDATVTAALAGAKPVLADTGGRVRQLLEVAHGWSTQRSTRSSE